MLDVAVTETRIVERFRAARHDQQLVVLEGFHAVKHALRFGAELQYVAGTQPAELEGLAEALAPDLRGRFEALVDVVDPDEFARFGPHAPRMGVAAIATRPTQDPGALLEDRPDAPIVLLEDPRDLGNMGACVRVAAAVDAAAVLTTGIHDPWHADAVRGAAGLHFAVPVARVDELPPSSRPLVAVDPDGEPFAPARMPANSVLAFGTERYGLSDGLLRQAQSRISIPMRAGVSSLNLATSVAAVLYAWRITRDATASAAP